MSEAYRKAGVDIAAGNRFVEMIGPLIARTKRRGVIGGIGGFGGLFALDVAEMREPVLVAGTDGVGTKLKFAIELGILDTIGIDLVAMCVNDIACSGAEPLFFLDYFATSKLKPEGHARMIEGIAKACQLTKCALIGGETAEMPELYREGDFDLAGFAVGIVDRAKIIDGSEIGAGNAIMGLASSGFHSNGFALVRRIVRDSNLSLSGRHEALGRPLGEALLEPTKLYSPVISHLARSFHIKGIAHITGGGFWDNIPRILPAGVQAAISRGSWEIPELFRLFQRLGGIADAEMLHVFNCGIGLVVILPAEEAKDALEAVAAQGERAWIIGATRQRAKGEPAIVIE